MEHSSNSATIVDVLETILDKGVVIAGDIKVGLTDVQLLTIKIRLVVASVDKAKEMGMDWWETDSYFSSKATEQLEHQNLKLNERIEQLEKKLETKEIEGEKK
ncbi:gas vesicle protein [Priestia endophytica]|uniref:gas vesicle protein n=1 Tax=Priestia endophytica TaxID=135735 RepID=UPI002280A2F5|nr:gas vesicle protein [Priestia endophytica]MCY8230389.1 gas vesicle protein [Priestia endophytica]